MIPTRGSNILVLVLCNDSLFVSNVNVVMLASTSDYNCMEFTLHVSQPIHPTYVDISNHDFFKADYDSNNIKLAQINLEECFVPVLMLMIYGVYFTK